LYGLWKLYNYVIQHALHADRINVLENLENGRRRKLFLEKKITIAVKPLQISLYDLKSLYRKRFICLSARSGLAVSIGKVYHRLTSSCIDDQTAKTVSKQYYIYDF
jgi:hypothetical protein